MAMGYPQAPFVGSFDTKNHLLREIFCRETNIDIHHLLNGHEVNQSQQQIVEKVSESEDFIFAYNKLACFIMKALKIKGKIQKNPNIRVVRKGDHGTRFHVDSWAGYDPQTINVWMPLSFISSESGLFLLSNNDSIKLLSEFQENKLSLKEFDNRTVNYSRSKNIKYGEYLVFSGRTVHGSKLFNNQEVRISMDFRILPNNIVVSKNSLSKNFIEINSNDCNSSRVASKDINKYKDSSLEVNVILFSARMHEKTSHDDQRAIISNFCIKNCFNPVRIFSEIYGTDDCPGLVDLIEKYPLVPIVLFSVKSYHLSNDATLKALSALEFHKVGACYALEDTFIGPNYHILHLFSNHQPQP